MVGSGGADKEAESLFDDIAETYEDAYGENPALRRALDRLVSLYPDGASVLDVGCGPGGPASYLADKGFAITGIDVSANMVDHCQKTVKGEFHKASMHTFEPKAQFDAIIALFSFFQQSYRSTYSFLFKAASWLRPGGTLLMAVVAAEDIVPDLSILQQPGEYVENFDVPFMGKRVSCTLVSSTGWLSVIQKTGLAIHNVERYCHQPKGSSSFQKEDQTFITARRTHLEPLFGPHPLPAFRRPPHDLSQNAWQPFAEILTRHELDAVVNALKSNNKVLDVGSGHGGKTTPQPQPSLL